MAKTKKSYLPLKTTKDLRRTMGRHYLLARYHRWWGRPLKRPLAWVTSGAPVEILRVFGIYTVYPENYGAVCGTARASLPLCQEAENRGYGQDLCSYARSNLGAVYRPQLAPAGGLPAPDLLVTCNNICGTVLKWYEVLARHYRVPLLIIDTPFVAEDGELPKHAVEYVRGQLLEMVAALERLTGRKFDAASLEKHLLLSREVVELWREIRYLCRSRPSPLNIPDLFLHLAPIVVARGTKGAVAYYRKLLAEVKERVRKGVAAVPGERYRLLWDNIAIWPRLFSFFKTFTEKGACFVVDTYTGGWAVEMYPGEDLLESLARTYTGIFLNQGIDYRARDMIRLIEEFAVDGFVMHSNRSCKPYSLVQEEIRRRVTAATGVPGLLVEADMTDPRAYAEEQVHTRVQAFLEALQSR
ncbi:MAG: 2-hydroxyacyl-CoA dehydratase subunit D [Desulfotomaculales bacterium]